MSRGVFSSANHFLLSSGLITAVPLSMAAWINPSSVAGNNTIMGLYYTGGALTTLDGWRLRINATTGAPLFSAGNAVSNAGTAHGTAVTTGVWNHVGGVTASATSRFTYIGGVASAENTVNITPTLPVDKTVIGIFYQQNNAVTAAASTNYIAQCAYWNVALTDAEMARLALGDSPLSIRSANLIAGYNLISGDASGNEPDYIGSNHMIEQGTVPDQTEYPNMNYLYLNTLKKRFQAVNRASTF